MKRVFLSILVILSACSNGDVVYKYPLPPEEARDAKMGSILTGDKEAGIYLFQTGRKDGVPGGSEQVGPSKILWQAALDELSSMPIITSDYNGGMIATDWYSKAGDANARSKINVLIKGNKLAANNVKVTIFRQHLTGGVWTSTPVEAKDNSQKEMDILNRAREFSAKK